MTIYNAKVVVEYNFEFDSEDTDVTTLEEAENYAWLNYEEYKYSADVYSVDVEEEEYEEDK